MKEYFKIILGTFIVAMAYVYFFTPHKIIPGGVYGISIIIHYKTIGLFSAFPDGLPIGATSLFFNVPLIIIAYKMFGGGYLWRTIIAFVFTAIFVDLFTYIQGVTGVVALVPDDVLLSCIYGSIFMGLGAATILKAKGTSAGSDVIAKVINHFIHIPVGYAIIIVDSTIVLIGLIAFGDIRIPMYSLFVVFLFGKMVDVFIQGLSFNKAVFIICNNPNELANRIMKDMHRGGTFIHSTGMYQGAEKRVIYTVIENKQVYALREHVLEIDPNAFVTIIDAKEILGNGFSPIKLD